MNSTQVLETHRERLAVVYIRQSSAYQVEHNLESQKRQYQLVDRAHALGWLPDHCLTIDDDLGRSGAQSYNRPGYQRLISMLALREVGIVLGLEVSRLARNSLDWYQLLELAAAFDVLIADEDGIYNPGEFNDRLLLGLKGTISEVELYQIRSRMMRGRMNKVKRGELNWVTPVGLECDLETRQLRLSADESVRHTLSLVFQLFSQLHSIRGVLKYLCREGVDLPHQLVRRGFERRIVWRKPTYDSIYGYLTKLVYAGVYCYGQRRTQTDPISHQSHVQKCARETWAVFLPDHHPGYITLEEFEKNQKILENNRYQYPNSQGAARKGSALLPGLVFCQHCGRRMRVRYTLGRPYYTCDAAERRFAAPICNRASASRVDALVEDLFLTVINTETLEKSIVNDVKLKQEAGLVERSWQEKLKRQEYQADLARRRYEHVDPANRMVAQTLETEWNQSLIELETVRKEFQVQQITPQELTSTAAQMREVVAHLRDYWYKDGVSFQEKKDLLRCLIEQVFLQTQGKVIRAQIHWYGGAISELDVPKYLFSTPYLYHRIRELAHTLTDAEIAERMNQEKLLTAKGKPWNARRVMDFRKSNLIPSTFVCKTQTLRTGERTYLSSAEAAERLGVSKSAIQKWYRLGLLPGKRDPGHSVLWIQLSDDLEYRLKGGAVPDPRMLTVRALCRTRKMLPDQVLAWAQSQGHIIYRLRAGKSLRFYILPSDSSAPQ
jgi:DNA invertase Pin-like site-specific DNA recombinase